MSAKQTTITVEDCLRGAWQALLRGDTAERDRLVAAAQKAFRPGEDAVPDDRPVAPIDLTPTARKPDVIYLPFIPSKDAALDE